MIVVSVLSIDFGNVNSGLKEHYSVTSVLSTTVYGAIVQNILRGLVFLITGQVGEDVNIDVRYL